MTKRLYVLDERDVWYRPLISVAHSRGWDARRVMRGADLHAPGHCFVRTHADPRVLPTNQQDYRRWAASGLTMLQDAAQVEVYEDKSAQFHRWGDLMPETWRLTRLEHVEAVADGLPYPIVSKADQGASSMNVRVLRDRAALLLHADQVFRQGVTVNCCSGGATVVQKDYLLLQRFIPHTTTWRVNIVGTQLAIFKRYCYPDRPVAQTGNVEPVKLLDEATTSLLQYAQDVFQRLGTYWCAIDVLRDVDGSWKLLETSLAWPWPSPGDCNNGLFFRQGTLHPSGRLWIDMMDVLMDEVEAGVWDA